MQRHGVGDVSTTGASLTVRVEAVDFDHLPPIPFALVFQLTGKLARSTVADAWGETVVGKHPAHVQVFRHDGLVFTHETGAEAGRGLEVVARAMGRC
jgi:hypothetical protein